MKTSFGLYANAVQSSNVLCTSCCLLKNVIHASTQSPIPAAQNSLFKNILNTFIRFLIKHCLFSIYIFLSTLLFGLDNDVSLTSKRRRFLNFFNFFNNFEVLKMLTKGVLSQHFIVKRYLWTKNPCVTRNVTCQGLPYMKE